MAKVDLNGIAISAAAHYGARPSILLTMYAASQRPGGSTVESTLAQNVSGRVSQTLYMKAFNSMQTAIERIQAAPEPLPTPEKVHGASVVTPPPPWMIVEVEEDEDWYEEDLVAADEFF